jgi:hypothetical protein
MNRHENAMCELAASKENVDRMTRLITSALLACPNVAGVGYVNLSLTHFGVASELARTTHQRGVQRMTDAEFLAVLDNCPACNLARNAYQERRKEKAILSRRRSAVMRIGQRLLKANRVQRLMKGLV